MGKKDKLKKRYVIGSIVIIVFQILLMKNVLLDKNQLSNRDIVEEHKNGSKTINNVLTHPTMPGIHANHITLIGVGLIGTGYLLMIIEERKKKETKGYVSFNKIGNKHN